MTVLPPTQLTGTRPADPVELGLVPISVPIDGLIPSPENAQVYRPVDPDDPDVRALADSIRREGVKSPLTVTMDRFVVSGHRRLVASKLAGLVAVPCITEPFRRIDDPDRFLQLLVANNIQRVKDAAEQVREQAILVNPDEAYAALVAHRQAALNPLPPGMTIEGSKTRAAISAAKQPFLAAIVKVMDDRRDFWPLSDRQIHYGLLNEPPLTHASKPKSRYANTPASYKALTELLTRARLAGLISWDAIADETRPVSAWPGHRDFGAFFREELAGFLNDYRRNLMQSQPRHIEIIGEKNTVAAILRPIAWRFCIPLTITRGFCSLPPRYEIAERFRLSGKDELVLLLVTDHDPDGEEIAQAFARSMRDDFGVENVHPIRVALTNEQVQRFNLPPMLAAKKSSTNYKKFNRVHGDDVHELEALPPNTLQQLLTQAIDDVIDRRAFNAEIDHDRADAHKLEAIRRHVQTVLKGLDL